MNAIYLTRLESEGEKEVMLDLDKHFLLPNLSNGILQIAEPVAVFK